jgi:23S rRNA (uridine2552-2'-O)-methyltransferase
MGKKKGGKNSWEDHYTRRAKKDGYPARSVYKLEEIQKKHRLIRPGNRVLDLGCAPGSWLMYAAGQAGGGEVIGIDLKPVTATLPKNARAVVGDALDAQAPPLGELSGGFDVVLSDMAPATTGRKEVDAARSYDLCMAALATARRLLRPGGRFCCKIFTGEDFKRFSEAVKAVFSETRIHKPKSSRKASKEIYIIGTQKKKEENDNVGAQQMVDHQA